MMTQQLFNTCKLKCRFKTQDRTETCYLMTRIKVEHVLDTGSLPKSSQVPCEEVLRTLEPLRYIELV